MEDGNVNKRLEEAIDRLGMTGRAFSEKTGIDSSNLSKKLQGKVKITRNDFRAIRENTAINVDWLVTGMGPMLTEEGGADSKPRPKGVPYFNVDFNLGYEDMYEVPETVEYYIDVPGMNKATCWCRTTGKRKKTGEPFFFVLLPEAMRILRKYRFKLPVVAEQSYNEILKKVARDAGIDKPLSSHWGRRTAAVILVNHGVRIEVVAKILGHASVSTTEQFYAQIVNKTIIREMKKTISEDSSNA